jgi:hypothetical protein
MPDNAFIEPFNGSFRDECLNLNWFASIAEARRHAKTWRRDDNESRPNMALNGLSPAEFARQQRTCDPAKDMRQGTEAHGRRVLTLRVDHEIGALQTGRLLKLTAVRRNRSGHEAGHMSAPDPRASALPSKIPLASEGPSTQAVQFHLPPLSIGQNRANHPQAPAKET